MTKYTLVISYNDSKKRGEENFFILCRCFCFAKSVHGLHRINRSKLFFKTSKKVAKNFFRCNFSIFWKSFFTYQYQKFWDSDDFIAFCTEYSNDGSCVWLEVKKRIFGELVFYLSVHSIFRRNHAMGRKLGNTCRFLLV